MPQLKDMPFAVPGGEVSVLSSGQPVDLAHLSVQTQGDRALEAEVLGLFARQACDMAARLARADGHARSRLAHTLKGSARSIGAFHVAALAERIERVPHDAEALGALAGALDDACDFIAAISR